MSFTSISNSAGDVHCAKACYQFVRDYLPTMPNLDTRIKGLCGNFQKDCCIGNDSCDKGFLKTTCWKDTIVLKCSELKNIFPNPK